MDQPLYAEDGSILLPKMKIPSVQGVSPEAKSWLDTMYLPYNKWNVDANNSVSTSMYLDIMTHAARVISESRKYAEQLFDVDVNRVEINGVIVDVVDPVGKEKAVENENIIIHFCGGVAFLGDNVLHNSIAMASISNTRVLVPRYRPFEKHSFKEQCNDVLSVYEGVIEQYAPSTLCVYGESSGAQVAATLVVLANMNKLRIPNAVALIGINSLRGDSFNINRYMDPMAIIIRNQLKMREQSSSLSGAAKAEFDYDPKDPLFSPIYSDLSNFPPTILFSGTRDTYLSSTVSFHRELRRAGIRSELNVFEAMPHAHHTNMMIPESREVYEEMTSFFSGIVSAE